MFPLPEKCLTATMTVERNGKLSYCLKSSFTYFLEISANIFIRFLDIPSLSEVAQAKMLISEAKVLKLLSGFFLE